MPTQSEKSFSPTQTVLSCTEHAGKASVSMCRIQTPWRNPACSAFLTAPTDVITGPCDPWWSDSSPALTPLPLAQTQAAGSGRSAPPRTASPPVLTTCRVICLNCKHQKVPTRNNKRRRRPVLPEQGVLRNTWHGVSGHHCLSVLL